MPCNNTSTGKEAEKTEFTSQKHSLPTMLWKFFELKNERRQSRKDIKKAFILLSQISSPLISSSCNFPCSAENQLHPSPSWKMLFSSSHFSPFNDSHHRTTLEQVGFTLKHTWNTAALHGDTKLPQEGTWCIPGTTQQLGWSETPLWAHRVELLLTAADSLWQSSPAGSHCSWTQTQPEASISHHLHPGNRESLILFSFPQLLLSFL